MAVDFSILQRAPTIGSRIMAGQQMAREQALQNRLLARQDLQFQQQQEDRARQLQQTQQQEAIFKQAADMIRQAGLDPDDPQVLQQFTAAAVQSRQPQLISLAGAMTERAAKRREAERRRTLAAQIMGGDANAAPAAAVPAAPAAMTQPPAAPAITATTFDEGAARPEMPRPSIAARTAGVEPPMPMGPVRELPPPNALAPAGPAPVNTLVAPPQATAPATPKAVAPKVDVAALESNLEKFERRHTQLLNAGLDKEATVFYNSKIKPLEKRIENARRAEERVETRGFQERNLAIQQQRADLEGRRADLQELRDKAQAARDEARAKNDAATAERAQRTLDQADRRLAMAENAAARAADPEFQARMERARTMAAAVAKDDAALLSQGPSALEAGQRTLALLNRMVGDPKGQGAAAQPHPGFTGTIGMTFTPGMRFVPGTPEADFSAMLEQVQGGAFLEAYERLKGTGQITEIEGKKATQAITRMNTAISEREFMQAAKEFRDAIETAMSRTQARMSKAQRGAPGRGAVGGEPAPGAGGTVTPEARQQALEWLKQNPNDPRAAQIKQRLGM